MTANEFVIEVGNKISGRAIPVRTPNMLKAAEVLSPASLSFKGIKIASILVKRFKTTRFPVKGTDKRPIFGRAFLKSQSRNLEKRTATRARDIIAAGIGAKPEEIYFTAGGSESDNWALKATAEAYKEKGKHIITSKIEHHAILHTCEWLERQGFEVTYLDVDENGCINPADVEAAIRPDTILISIMFANNEIGTIEPIAEIGAIAKAHGVLFHTDAVQAFGQEPIQVDEMNIDMLSSSGHKLNGPKGIGFLYIRKGVKIRSFVHGGAQERKRRAGTENVPGIVGFGKAAELAFASMEERTARERELRDYMISRFEKEIPYVKINGDREHRLANNVNACFRFVEGESMLIMLDMKGICASSGSACK